MPGGVGGAAPRGVPPIPIFDPEPPFPNLALKAEPLITAAGEIRPQKPRLSAGM